MYYRPSQVEMDLLAQHSYQHVLKSSFHLSKDPARPTYLLYLILKRFNIYLIKHSDLWSFTNPFDTFKRFERCHHGIPLSAPTFVLSGDSITQRIRTPLTSYRVLFIHLGHLGTVRLFQSVQLPLKFQSSDPSHIPRVLHTHQLNLRRLNGQALNLDAFRSLFLERCHHAVASTGSISATSSGTTSAPSSGSISATSNGTTSAPSSGSISAISNSSTLQRVRTPLASYGVLSISIRFNPDN
ncbi:hypothetical protein PG987_007388 [Apiospora arundinis]